MLVASPATETHPPPGQGGRRACSATFPPLLNFERQHILDHHIGGEVDREGESRRHGPKERAGQGRHERSSSLYGGCWLAQPVVT